MQNFNHNILSWCRMREQESRCKLKFERRFQVTVPLARRLGLEQELEGHSGCVNCLQWSEDGELLASGSDDFNIIIWNVLGRRSKHVLKSGHQGNIFAVKFLPYSNTHTVASAAADASVKICSTTTSECTQTYNCHMRRIKRLAVSKRTPFALWSGSEDGTVREFDVRTPHSCQLNKPCKNVLINLNGHTGANEVKCIQIHPLYPQYIAVGCSDPYVRLFDKRMLKLSDTNNSRSQVSQLQCGCVNYFAPGHLPIRNGRVRSCRRGKHYVTTHVNFSPDGKELIQNLGGEHVYIYDINTKRAPLVFTTDSHTHKSVRAHDGGQRTKNGESSLATGKIGYHNPVHNGLTCTYEMRRELEVKKLHTSNCELTDEALKLKHKGNDAFSQENYFQAVVCYNRALRLVSNSSVLYANRAAALLKRAWDGDVYAALRDSYVAVSLDPSHTKAYYRQAKCLFELKWYKEADSCLQRFKEKFPDQANGFSIRKLEADISHFLKQSTHKERSTNEQRTSPSLTNAQANEQLRRENALDYECRFVGACNTTTDIKEANYFGNDGQFIIAGSDCGCMLLWERSTANLIEAWQGDESIVNCLQPHPTSCLLATSGIDPVVRLWSPRSTADNMNDVRAKEVEGLVRNNQKRMNADPFEEMLRTMGYPTLSDIDSGGDDDDDDDDVSNVSMQCRAS